MAPAKVESVGYYCPSGLALECGMCHVAMTYPNPKHSSLMALVLAAEAEGWHIPFGGRVLCPHCNTKAALTVGRTSLNVDVVRHAYEATARGAIVEVGKVERNDGKK